MADSQPIFGARSPSPVQSEQEEDNPERKRNKTEISHLQKIIDEQEKTLKALQQQQGKGSASSSSMSDGLIETMLRTNMLLMQQIAMQRSQPAPEVPAARPADDKKKEFDPEFIEKVKEISKVLEDDLIKHGKLLRRKKKLVKELECLNEKKYPEGIKELHTNLDHTELDSLLHDAKEEDCVLEVKLKKGISRRDAMRDVHLFSLEATRIIEREAVEERSEQLKKATAKEEFTKKVAEIVIEPRVKELGVEPKEYNDDPEEKKYAEKAYANKIAQAEKNLKAAEKAQEEKEKKDKKNKDAVNKEHPTTVITDLVKQEVAAANNMAEAEPEGERERLLRKKKAEEKKKADEKQKELLTKALKGQKNGKSPGGARGHNVDNKKEGNNKPSKGKGSDNNKGGNNKSGKGKGDNNRKKGKGKGKGKNKGGKNSPSKAKGQKGKGEKKTGKGKGNW